MFVQHQVGSVFIPSFFQHCLSFLCGAEMLKLHFSDVGSLEVCACRQVSAGKKRERKGRGTGRKKKRQNEKREPARRGDLPLISPS